MAPDLPSPNHEEGGNPAPLAASRTISKYLEDVLTGDTMSDTLEEAVAAAEEMGLIDPPDNNTPEIDRKAIANKVIEYIEINGLDSLDKMVDELCPHTDFMFDQDLHDEWVMQTFGEGTPTSVSFSGGTVFYDPCSYLDISLVPNLPAHHKQIVLILPFMVDCSSYPDMGQNCVHQIIRNTDADLAPITHFFQTYTECDRSPIPRITYRTTIKCYDDIIFGYKISVGDANTYQQSVIDIFPHDHRFMRDILSRVYHAVAGPRESAERLALKEFSSMAQSSYRRNGNRADTLAMQAEDSKRSATDLVERIARLRQEYSSLMQDSQAIRDSLPVRVIEEIQEEMILPEAILSHKGVREVNITHGNSEMEIKVYTNQFNMICEYFDSEEDSDQEYFLAVQPAVITIHSWSDTPSVQVSRYDPGVLCHPNVSESGSVCFGHADVPISECWGIRDWHGVVNVVLGWMTQFGDEDPYRSPRELAEEYGELNFNEPRGWQPAPVNEQPESVDESDEEVPNHAEELLF